MSRAKRSLLLAAELVAWAAFALFAFVSVTCFDTARQAPELWEYLRQAPDRLEEVQAKWILGGAVSAVPALGALAGAVGMEIHRRRKEGGRDGYSDIDLS